jgi:hypothetical protein
MVRASSVGVNVRNRMIAVSGFVSKLGPAGIACNSSLGNTIDHRPMVRAEEFHRDQYRHERLRAGDGRNMPEAADIATPPPSAKVRPFDQLDLRLGGEALRATLCEAESGSGRLDIYQTVRKIFDASGVSSRAMPTAPNGSGVYDRSKVRKKDTDNASVSSPQ